MDDTTDKRVCLLTGAGGVLGTAFCRRMSAAYDIVALYRSVPPAVPSQDQQLVDPLDPAIEPELNEARVFAVQGDVCDPEARKRAVELALARFGRIDLVVNAAVLYRYGPILGSRRLLDSLEEQFRTNAIAPVELAVEVAEQFWKTRDLENAACNRNVVNVSSWASLGNVLDGGGGYAASKVALNHLTRAMAQDFEKIKVRANAVVPAPFPSQVKVGQVLRAIRTLDRGAANGRLLLVDAKGQRLR